MKIKGIVGKLVTAIALVALTLSMTLSGPAMAGADQRDPGHKAGDKGHQDTGKG